MKIRERINDLTTQYPPHPSYQKDWRERVSDKLLIITDLFAGVLKERVFESGEYPYTPSSLKMSRFSYISWLTIDAAFAFVTVPIGLVLRALSSSRAKGEENYQIEEAQKQEIFSQAGIEVLSALIQAKARYKSLVAFPILQDWLNKQEKPLSPVFYECMDAVLTEEEEKKLLPRVNYIAARNVLLDQKDFTENDQAWWISQNHDEQSWKLMLARLMQLTHLRDYSSEKRLEIFDRLDVLYKSSPESIQTDYKLPHKKCIEEVVELILRDGEREKAQFSADGVISRLRLIQNRSYEQKELVQRHDDLAEWAVYNLFALGKKSESEKPLSWIQDAQLKTNLERVIKGEPFRFLQKLDQSAQEMRMEVFVQQFGELIKQHDPLIQICLQLVGKASKELHDRLVGLHVPFDDVMVVEEYSEGFKDEELAAWLGESLLDRYREAQAFVIGARGSPTSCSLAAINAIPDIRARQLACYLIQRTWQTTPEQFTKAPEVEVLAEAKINQSLKFYCQFCEHYEWYSMPDAETVWRDLLFNEDDDHYFKALISVRQGVDFLNRYPRIIQSITDELKERQLFIKREGIAGAFHPLKEFVSTEKKFRDDLQKTREWFKNRGSHQHIQYLMQKILDLMEKYSFSDDPVQNLQVVARYVDVYQALAELVVVYMPVYDELAKDTKNPLMLISCVWQRLPRYSLLLAEICKEFKKIVDNNPIYTPDLATLNRSHHLLRWFLVKFNSQANRGL